MLYCHLISFIDDVEKFPIILYTLMTETHQTHAYCTYIRMGAWWCCHHHHHHHRHPSFFLTCFLAASVWKSLLLLPSLHPPINPHSHTPTGSLWKRGPWLETMDVNENHDTHLTYVYLTVEGISPFMCSVCVFCTYFILFFIFLKMLVVLQMLMLMIWRMICSQYYTVQFGALMR